MKTRSKTKPLSFLPPPAKKKKTAHPEQTAEVGSAAAKRKEKQSGSSSASVDDDGSVHPEQTAEVGSAAAKRKEKQSGSSSANVDDDGSVHPEQTAEVGSAGAKRKEKQSGSSSSVTTTDNIVSTAERELLVHLQNVTKHHPVTDFRTLGEKADHFFKTARNLPFSTSVVVSSLPEHHRKTVQSMAIAYLTSVMPMLHPPDESMKADQSSFGSVIKGLTGANKVSEAELWYRLALAEARLETCTSMPLAVDPGVALRWEEHMSLLHPGLDRATEDKLDVTLTRLYRFAFQDKDKALYVFPTCARSVLLLCKHSLRRFSLLLSKDYRLGVDELQMVERFVPSLQLLMPMIELVAKEAARFPDGYVMFELQRVMRDEIQFLSNVVGKPLKKPPWSQLESELGKNKWLSSFTDISLKNGRATASAVAHEMPCVLLTQLPDADLQSLPEPFSPLVDLVADLADSDSENEIELP